MNRLEEVVKTLKTHIGEGVEAALEYLEQVLDHNSDRYNDYIQIKSRYNGLQRELLLGVVDHSTYDISRNNISKALLLLAEELTEKDLVPEGGAKEEEEDKYGEILYHVPELMQLNHEEKCTVRIAFVLEQLMRDWVRTEVDVVKSIRISEIMAVNLLNVDETDPPFTIRTLSETVQFIDKEDFTEWIFYVKPVKTGRFPLVLRVSVIEMINNKEYKKDIVLEEEITVQAEEVPPAGEAAFKSAGTNIMLSNGPVPTETAAPPAAQAGEAGKKGLSKVAGALLATAAIAAAGYFGVGYYQEEQTWKEARKNGNISGYQRYLEKYPNGRHDEDARFMIDSLSRIDTVSGISAPSTTVPETENSPAADTTAQPQDPATRNEPPAAARNPPKPAPGRAGKPAGKSKPDAGKAKPGKIETRTSPNVSANTANKPDLSPPASAPLLRGNNFYFKIPRFAIVETGDQNLDLKFYQYNQYREVLAVLGTQGNVRFQPGTRLAFVPDKGDAIFAELKYVATIQQAQNRLEGYFTISGDDLTRLSKEKFKSVRIIDAGNHALKVFNLSRAGSKNLNRRAEDALKQLEEKR